MEHISKISCKEKQRNEITNTKREKKTANKKNKVLKQTIDSLKKRNVLFWEGKKKLDACFIERYVSSNNKQKSQRKFMTFKWQNYLKHRTEIMHIEMTADRTEIIFAPWATRSLYGICFFFFSFVILCRIYSTFVYFSFNKNPIEIDHKKWTLHACWREKWNIRKCSTDTWINGE